MRAGPFGVVSIRIVESDISLFESAKIFEIWVNLKEQIFEPMNIRIEAQMKLIRRRIRIPEISLVFHNDPLIMFDEPVLSGRYEFKLSMSRQFTLIMALKIVGSDLAGQSTHVQLYLMVYVLYHMERIYDRNGIRKMFV